MIQLNYRDSRPIYEQIVDGYRQLIIQGLLNKDDKLPSVRELASSLAINPNTIQRAYRELEVEGFVYTVKGKGCFVAGLPKQNTARIQELLQNIEKCVAELEYLGVSREKICKEIQEKSLLKGGERK